MIWRIVGWPECLILIESFGFNYSYIYWYIDTHSVKMQYSLSPRMIESTSIKMNDPWHLVNQEFSRHEEVSSYIKPISVINPLLLPKTGRHAHMGLGSPTWMQIKLLWCARYENITSWVHSGRREMPFILTRFDEKWRTADITGTDIGGAENYLLSRKGGCKY